MLLETSVVCKSRVLDDCGVKKKMYEYYRGQRIDGEMSGKIPSVVNRNRKWKLMHHFFHIASGYGSPDVWNESLRQNAFDDLDS